MPVVTLHTLDKIVFPSSFELCELSNASITAGIESMIEHPAGHVWPMFRANMKQAPVIEGSTPELAMFLGTCGVGGVALGASTFYLKKKSTTGNVARATTEHQRLVINSLILHWTQIKLPHNGKAEVSFIVTANYDGTNDPFVWTGSVALSGNLTATEYFGAGPWSINGTAVNAIQDVTIESGITLLRAGGESEEFDTFIGIEQGKPSITLTTQSLTNWGVLGLRGTALNGSAGIVGYARRYAANGSRVANATASHIKFQGLLGSAIPVNSSGQNTGPISDSLKCELVATSDSVLPLLITTASAIT